MRFEDVLQNGRLWAVVYDGDQQDILSQTFTHWLDPAFLEDFFSRNSKDLEEYFHITNLDVAIYDTIEDAASLSCLILDIRPDANLDTLFRPLETSVSVRCFFQEKRQRGKGRRHTVLGLDCMQSSLIRESI